MLFKKMLTWMMLKLGFKYNQHPLRFKKGNWYLSFNDIGPNLEFNAGSIDPELDNRIKITIPFLFELLIFKNESTSKYYGIRINFTKHIEFGKGDRVFGYRFPWAWSKVKVEDTFNDLDYRFLFDYFTIGEDKNYIEYPVDWLDSHLSILYGVLSPCGNLKYRRVRFKLECKKIKDIQRLFHGKYYTDINVFVIDANGHSVPLGWHRIKGNQPMIKDLRKALSKGLGLTR